MTRAHEVQPLVRIVSAGAGGELVLEIRRDTVTIRPLRTRRGNAKSISWAAVYRRACWLAGSAKRQGKQKRGLLAVERRSQ